MHRLLLLTALLLTGGSTLAQLPLDEDEFFSRLTTREALPEKILSTRTAVFHSYTFSEKELALMQGYFQRSGIDAVAYFDIDLLTGGRDPSQAMAQYLLSREITTLILARKTAAGFTLWIAEYNQKADFVDRGQQAWRSDNRLLEEILKELYRTSANSGLKRENYLINEYPENGFTINAIDGRRNEFFAVDLKVDPLAVPRFNDEQKDRELEEIMKLYPHKYTFTDPKLSEAELRKQGLLYVLRFVHTRVQVAKSILGYDVSRASSAVVSITYPGTEPQVKNIPANQDVYKFYFKHIDSGNTFLGTKWDADETWQQALINQIKGYKAEFKIN